MVIQHNMFFVLYIIVTRLQEFILSVDFVQLGVPFKAWFVVVLK